MIGSAVQNGVALSDSIFLFYYDETDFAAIGLVSVFYLIISSIGYGFSKGGQILIARRLGQSNQDGLGTAFWSMQLFQLFVAVILFMFLMFLSPYFLNLFIHNKVILDKCITFLEWRSWSIFFSYLGLGYIALYTGVARTAFIVVDVMIMMIINVILNYAFIFGKFGFNEMGIAGAGLGSAIAETAAFLIFFLYATFDKRGGAWKFSWAFIDGVKERIQKLATVGLPVVVQSIVGLGSWFVFFAFIEKLGERALAITNFGRILYLALSVPTWGFSSGINTIVSFLIGQGQKGEVLKVTRKTSILNLGVTYLFALPLLLFPDYTLSWVFTDDNISLLYEGIPILRVILVTLIFFCIGGVYYNGLVGTGDTWFGLYIQIVGVIFYVLYLHLVINVLEFSLTIAWTGEMFFWIFSLSATALYLRSGRWRRLEI